MTGPLEGDRPLSEEAREGNADPGDEARQEASETDDTYTRTNDNDDS
jgi:hypothetical protein